MAHRAVIDGLRALVLCACFAAAPAPAAAQPFMADADWRRFESEHFRVLYPAGYEVTARWCAAAAEEAYRLLTPLFQWEPRRITMIISDGSDAHNGFATIFPEPTIQLELHPPDRRQTIYSPDYLRQVILHELTHVLQLDQTDRLRGTMRRVFGTVWPTRGDPLSLLVTLLTLPPHAVGPVWFLEGGAQWAETEFGARGRGETALHHAYLRALVLADRVPAIDEAVLASPDWPYGTAAYLWGLAVMREWQRTHETSGVAVAAELSRTYARGVSALFEPVTRRLLGDWAHRAWREATAAIVAEQRQIAEAIAAAGPTTDGERLTPPGLLAWNPVVSGDGRWVHFVGSPADRRTALYRLDRHTGELRRLPVRLSPTSRLWRLQSGWLLFTRLDPVGTDEWRVTLYRCRDNGTGVTRLGRGRWTESAPAEFGVFAAIPVVSDGPVRTAFERRAVRGMFSWGSFRGDVARLRPAFFTRGTAGRETLPGLLHSPTWVRDRWSNGRLAVVQVERDATRILLFGRPTRDADLTGQEPNDFDEPPPLVLHEQEREILHMSWDRAGQRLLFVSGEAGVLNIYALPVPGDLHTQAPDAQRIASRLQPRRLTNATVGFLEVAPVTLRDRGSPDGESGAGAVAVALDADGPHLVWLSEGELAPRDEPLPDLLPAWPFLDGERVEPGPLPADWAAVGEPDVRRHRLFDGLTFQQWHPFLVMDGTNTFAAGAAVRFADPLQRASLDAQVGYNWSVERWFGSLGLAMRPGVPTVTLQASHTTLAYANRFDLAPDGPALHYYEDVSRLSLGVGAPIRRLDATWRLRGAFELERRVPAESLLDVPSTEPTRSPAPFAGWRPVLLGTASVSSLTRFPRSIGPEGGGFASLTVRYRPPWLDAAEHWVGGSLSLGAVAGLPGGSHQLELRVAAGWSVERETLQDGFAIGTGAGPFAVRGYPFADELGRHALFAGAAYRFPLIQIHRGILSLPLYARMLVVELFAEAATAFDTSWRELQPARHMRPSLGGELQLDIAAGGTTAGTVRVRLGYAYATERSPVADRHVVYLDVGLPLF